MSDNQANNKRIAKNTFLLYLRSIGLMLIAFYTSRIVLQSLGVENYGIYNVVGGVVVLFKMLNSTLASASQRFITFELGKKDGGDLRKVFSTCLTLHIILAIILVVLIESIGVWLIFNELSIPSGRMDAAFWVLQFSIATLFVDVISVPFNATIIAHERMNAFAYIGILEGCLKLAIAFILFCSPIDRLILYAVLMFGVSVLLRFIYGYYCQKHFSETHRVKLALNPSLFKEMFSFAGWNLVGNVSLVLRNQGVDILLNTNFGVVVNAAKGISNQVETGVYQFVSNFQTAITPQLTKAIAEKDISRSISLSYKCSRYSFLLLCFFAVPIMFCIDPILSFWLTDVPEWSSDFVRYTLIYLLFETIARLLINSVLAHGNIKCFQIVLGGTKLLALPLCYLALKLGGNPTTGIIVNIVLEFVCVWIRLYFNKKLLNYPVRKYITTVFIRCWATFLMALLLTLLFCNFLPSSFVVKLLISGGVTMASILFLGLDKSERLVIRHYVTNKIKK